ncbi:MULTISPECIES: hypothetical protein [Paenibacillus]|uniref:hypothetical protein n=1 Tax=Paenibacillus TaxID=44249 RepID=UPI00203DEE2E|nr:hypothetical protein [Paenibacillus camelliae]MCM3633030.1 hypothetical protein [Paenibacillus camelliae]
MINELFSSMHELLDHITQHYKDADEDQREDYCDSIGQLKETNDKILDHYVAVEEKIALFFELYRDIEEQEESEDEVRQEKLSSSPFAASSIMPQEQHHTSLQQLLYEAIQAEQEHVHEQEMPYVNVYSIDQQNDGILCNECDLFVSAEHELALDQAQGYYKLFMFAEAASILNMIITEQPECNIARLYYGMSLMHLRNWNEAQRQFQLLSVLSDFPKWLALSYNALGCIQAIKLNMNQAELLFNKAYQLYPQFEDPLKNLQSCRQASLKQLSLYFGSTELCCM